MARDTAVTSDLASVSTHWLLLYSILVVNWPNKIMLPGLPGSCFGVKTEQIKGEQRPRNLRRGWVAARAAALIGVALPFFPRFIPMPVCLNLDAIVIFTQYCVCLAAGSVWLCPVAQLMSSVEIPPNSFCSFQLPCLILNKFCIWPMIKPCQHQVLVSLCSREPHFRQDGTILSNH